jgi:broad specificity phosphatase PhoE
LANTFGTSSVLSSPSQRARQTCELVGLNRVAEIDPDLAEWDYGDYEGRRSVDIRAGRTDWDIYRDGCPHGETPAHISTRADQLIARLCALEGNIALFSHGQFGGVLAARWIGLPIAEARHFLLGTASLSMLAFDPHHPEVPIIAVWNAAAYRPCTDPTHHNESDKVITTSEWSTGRPTGSDDSSIRHADSMCSKDRRDRSVDEAQALVNWALAGGAGQGTS